MPKLRVAGIVTDLHFAGGENRVLSIARSVDRDRFDYTVATLYRPMEDLDVRLGSMRDDFAAAGIDILDVGLIRPGARGRTRAVQLASTAYSIGRNIISLREWLKRKNIDLVDLHLVAAVVPGVPAAISAGIPVAVTLYHHKFELTNPLLRFMVRSGLRRANAIFTDSQVRADELRQYIGRNGQPVFVVPNGVQLLPHTVSPQQVRQSLGIPVTARTIVGQVARLIPDKGFETLIDAAYTIVRRRPDVCVLGVGFSPSGSEYLMQLRRRVDELGIAGRVLLHSWRGRIADIWNIIDVHVHASHFDSLPNAIIEGMSLAKPAVVTSVGGIPDLVSHEETGLIVPPMDSHALAQAVLRLLDEPELGRRLGLAALEVYRRRYTPEVTTRAIEQRWLEIVSASGRSITHLQHN